MRPRTHARATVARRSFLTTAASAPALLLGGCAASPARRNRARTEHGEHEGAEVTPGEDLMQEHGVLERILLFYEESARRFDLGEDLDPAGVRAAADIVRRFVEDYHEALEEEFVFPRLDAARREEALVAILRRQHQRGRELTDEIVRLSGGSNGGRLAEVLRGFSRMYRPHAAREETVLFPAFRGLVGSGYRELGEQFEEQEHARFGEDGFATVVAEVARLEAALGIDDLAKFTTP